MKRICLVASGMHPTQLRLQPWCYLHQVCRELHQRGHQVSIITDGQPTAEAEELEGVPIARIPTVTNSRWNYNHSLYDTLKAHQAEVVLWHLGKTSFLHQDFTLSDATNIGIFTSPLYHATELAALGIGRLIRGYQLSAMHVLGTLMPNRILRQSLDRNPLDGLVVQTHTTRDRLLEQGVRPDEITVISPGIDDAWNEQQADESLRAQFGFERTDKVIAYFGSPAALRGLHTLLRAFRIARTSDPQLKLLILSRRHADELIREDAHLGRLLNDQAISPHVYLKSGYLSPHVLIRYIAATDVVALPFELVPSDAPLSLLEAQALSKPIITTEIGCLSELTKAGRRFLAQPADVPSLVRAIHRATQGPRNRLGGQYTESPPVRRWKHMGAEWSHFIQSR